MKVRHSSRTDVGQTRDHNEDSYAVGEETQAEHLGELFIVCDGMGGHAAGEVASSMGVETILAVYYADPSEDRATVLKQALEQANTRIYARGRGSMGTTGVTAVIWKDTLYVANVGDSRAYLVRDGAIQQISNDHSFVNDQVAAGILTPEQARTSPHRNVITRALGYQSEVLVDLFQLPLQVGDMILLSSDGLHSLINDDEIEQIATSFPLDEAVGRMIDLANQRGGFDNITAVLALVDALDCQAAAVVDQANGTGESASQSDLHAGITEQIPSLEDAAVAHATTPSLFTRPTPMLERRLTLLGGLLATVLLIFLIFVILLFMPRQIAPDSVTPSALPTSQGVLGSQTVVTDPTASTRPTLVPPSPESERTPPVATPRS